METSSKKVHAHRRGLFCRLLLCRSLGGNLKLIQVTNGCTPFLHFTMKYILILLLLFFLNVNAKATEIFNNLVIWSKDGTKVSYALYERPKISFVNEDLVVNSNGIEVYYSLSKMLRFTYEKIPVSAISNIVEEESSFKIVKESMSFSSLKPNSKINIYKSNGILMFSKTIVKGGDYTFSLNNLPNDVYLINVNGLTYKIVKK